MYWHSIGEEILTEVSNITKKLWLITPQPKYAIAYNGRGNTYINLKDYDKALADYSTAIQLDPKYTKAYNSRGITYSILKDYDKALADYTKAI